MTESEIRAGVKQFPWWGSIDLGHGIVTPGVRPPNAWDMYGLPKRMDGLRVLDVGANDGYFSFEAERRGAKQVMAIDLWDHPDVGTCGGGWDRFMFAKQSLESKVYAREQSVYALSDKYGYDAVLFIQVFYHLQHPFLAMQKLGAMCRCWMALETVLDAESVKEPAMVFYPGDELAHDPSNWWGPNKACIEHMARLVGFKTCRVIWEERYAVPPLHRACWMLEK